MIRGSTRLSGFRRVKARAAIAAAYDYDPRTAWNESERALQLDVGTADTHLLRAVLLEASGSLDAALRELANAANLDPLSIGIGSDYARLQIRRGEFEQGTERLRRMLDFDPNSIRVYMYLAEALQQRGRHNEAIAALEKTRALAPEYPRVLGPLGHAYAVAGKRDEALAMLHRLESMRKQKYVPAIDIAIIHAGLGDKDRTFEWMEKAYEERYAIYLQFLLTRAFDPLGSDPRFPYLRKKLGW